MYGEVWAGRYWNGTIFPWMCANILDYNQCTYELSLMFSPTRLAATALCTEDAVRALLTSQVSEEDKIA